MEVELIQSMWTITKNNEPHRQYHKIPNRKTRQSPSQHLREHVTVSHNLSTTKHRMHTMQSCLLWMGIVLIVGLTGEL